MEDEKEYIEKLKAEMLNDVSGGMSGELKEKVLSIMWGVKHEAKSDRIPLWIVEMYGEENLLKYGTNSEELIDFIEENWDSI